MQTHDSGTKNVPWRATFIAIIYTNGFGGCLSEPWYAHERFVFCLTDAAVIGHVPREFFWEFWHFFRHRWVGGGHCPFGRSSSSSLSSRFRASPLVETLDYLRLGPALPMSTRCCSRHEFFQAFSVFHCSSASMYYCQCNRRAGVGLRMRFNLPKFSSCA